MTTRTISGDKIILQSRRNSSVFTPTFLRNRYHGISTLFIIEMSYQRRVTVKITLRLTTRRNKCTRLTRRLRRLTTLMKKSISRNIRQTTLGILTYAITLVHEEHLRSGKRVKQLQRFLNGATRGLTVNKITRRFARKLNRRRNSSFHTPSDRHSTADIKSGVSFLNHHTGTLFNFLTGTKQVIRNTQYHKTQRTNDYNGLNGHEYNTG